MGNQINVALADSSESFLQMMADIIGSTPNCTVVGTAQDGVEILEIMNERKPDLLITDLLLRDKKGIDTLKSLKGKADAPRIIVVSAYCNEKISRQLSDLGVELSIPKPFDICELLSQIVREEHDDGERYYERINEALKCFGVLPSLRGYSFLRAGIAKAILSGGNVGAVTKDMYPSLAKEFGTTTECVERSMRNAIKRALRSGDEIIREEYFGISIKQLCEKATNSNFVHYMASFIIDSTR